MSRFSPQVAVQDRSGEILADALSQGVNNFLQLRRQRKADARTEARQDEDRELAMLPLAQQGIRQGTAPMEPIPTTGGLMQGDGQISPVAQAPGRYDQLTPHFYQDRQTQAEAQDRTARQAFIQALGKSRAEAQGKALGDPEGVQLDRDVKRSTITRNNATAAQPRAPMIGSPEWLAAQRALAGVQRETHQANRLFDVDHPTSDPQQGALGKPTEFSNKSAMLYPRAAEAAVQIDQVLATDEAPGLKSRLNRVPGVGNFLITDRERQLNQAGEVLATAILRLESGAAVSEEEARRYARQFLPQPGDDAGTLEQKRRLRQVAVQRLKVAASPSMRHEDGAATGTPAGTSAAPSRQPAGRTVTVNGKTFVLPE